MERHFVTVERTGVRDITINPYAWYSGLMKDFEPGQSGHDEASYAIDPTEMDPQGWLLQPVPDSEVGYIDLMRSNGGWNSIGAEKAMARLQRRLEPESSIAIIGRIFPGQSRSSFIALADALQKLQDFQGGIPGAEEQYPGLAVAFPGIPTPEELQEFLGRNSQEVDHMRGWPSTGELPYMALYGDTSGIVEFGALNVQSRLRTRAARDYYNGPI